jgi:hypothetical protein
MHIQINPVGKYQYFIDMWRTYLLYIYLFFLNVFQENGWITTMQIHQKEEKKIMTDKEYVEKRTCIFTCVLKTIPNTNINPLFYNKQSYDEYMKTEKETKLEQQWKRRILLEHTPRGNISMYYHPYKMGFAYSCDQKTLSYEILNACAMKYVKIFCCRDFFMDELTTNDYINPLIQLHFGVLEPTTTATEQQKPIEGPFIKRKSSVKLGVEKKEKEKMKNKFIYMGKLSNTSFLPSKNEVQPLNSFHSALLDGIEQNAEVQNQRLSYRDFIQSIQKSRESTNTEPTYSCF